MPSLVGSEMCIRDRVDSLQVTVKTNIFKHRTKSLTHQTGNYPVTSRKNGYIIHTHILRAEHIPVVLSPITPLQRSSPRSPLVRYPRYDARTCCRSAVSFMLTPVLTRHRRALSGRRATSTGRTPETDMHLLLARIVYTSILAQILGGTFYLPVCLSLIVQLGPRVV